MTDGRLASHLEGMILEATLEASPEWSGAPPHFTTAYYSPADPDAAFAPCMFLHQLDNYRTATACASAT